MILYALAVEKTHSLILMLLRQAAHLKLKLTDASASWIEGGTGQQVLILRAVTIRIPSTVMMLMCRALERTGRSIEMADSLIAVTLGGGGGRDRTQTCGLLRVPATSHAVARIRPPAR